LLALIINLHFNKVSFRISQRNRGSPNSQGHRIVKWRPSLNLDFRSRNDSHIPDAPAQVTGHFDRRNQPGLIIAHIPQINPHIFFCLQGIDYLMTSKTEKLGTTNFVRCQQKN
jgi:hypothetical protein